MGGSRRGRREYGRCRRRVREPREREIECPERRKTDSGEGSRLVRFHVPEYEDNILVEEVATLRGDGEVPVASVLHVDRLGLVVPDHREYLEAVRDRGAVGCLCSALVEERERRRGLSEGVGGEDSGGEGGHCQQDYAFGVSDKCCQCLIHPHIPVLRLRCAALRTNGGKGGSTWLSAKGSGSLFPLEKRPPSPNRGGRSTSLPAMRSARSYSAAVPGAMLVSLLAKTQ